MMLLLLYTAVTAQDICAGFPMGFGVFTNLPPDVFHLFILNYLYVFSPPSTPEMDKTAELYIHLILVNFLGESCILSKYVRRFQLTSNMQGLSLTVSWADITRMGNELHKEQYTI